ncbi:hypothetical protein GIB67_040090 [Kingdonia uniflora]|uniref:endo-polygalacturonase n=1 Tax=Kingdonia uniflora TaxID=39325 RepID=A0A7J7MUL3_9MAGN|nr:hypothetical protein GIB67_040090 [Kingdonia uniflora]
MSAQCFLLVLALFISLYSCYGSLPGHEELPYLSPPGDTIAYPTYLDTVENRKAVFSSKFRSLTSDEPEMFGGEGWFDQISSVKASSEGGNVVNVDNFGAKANGKDDSEAFKKAWKQACKTKSAIFVVPKDKKYLLNPTTFSGPCKPNLTLKLYGTIEASADRNDYKQDLRHWLIFQNIQNFKVEGGGVINGNGKIWWKNSCKTNKAFKCTHAPTAVTFYKCNNLKLNSIKIEDAQQMHVSIQSCVNVQATNLMVTAPEESPNTDGIHITATKNINLANCVIKTGDDCISIESGSKKVRATDITCGPGHGISIGSLGDSEKIADYVSDVVIDRATLTGTTNGVRIKTYQGGSGGANNIIFKNIVMKKVSNPIIIDQNYCDKEKPCGVHESAVQVNNVVYKNIKGTTESEVAIKFDCSKTYPCRGIVLQDVNLVTNTGETAKASCNNVKLGKKGKVSPQCS